MAPCHCHCLMHLTFDFADVDALVENDTKLSVHYGVGVLCIHVGGHGGG